MKTISALVLFFFIFSASVSAGPVGWVQVNGTQQTGPVQSDSQVELCKFNFISNFPEHGPLHLSRVLIVFNKIGTEHPEIDWDQSIGGVPGIDRAFRNLKVVNASGTELVSLPVLSQCPEMVLAKSFYVCEIAPIGAPLVTTTQIIMSTRVDITENAGRVGTATLVTDFRCGYGPTLTPNATGGTSGVTETLPEGVAMYGAIRSYIWRPPLLVNGFED